MTTRAITPEDGRWKTSYAVLRRPRRGESLASYTLLLDEENRLPGGATVRQIRLINSGPSTVANPGNFLSGKLFDLRELSVIAGGMPLKDLEALTLRPLVASGLVGIDPLRGQPGRFRFCPACLADRGIPLIYLLHGIEACPVHGVRLVRACVCREPILPFGQQDAGYCHGWGCHTRYDDLPAEEATEIEVARSRRVATMYEVLLTSVVEPTYVSRLGGALRHLIARRVENSDERRALRNLLSGGVSLVVIANVMVASGATADHIAELIAGRVASPAPRRDPERRYGSGACPNPSCPSVRTGKPELKVLPSEIDCLTCGTRYRADRILFSFDRIDGYPSWRAERNQDQLDDRRARVMAVCEDRLARDRTITIAGVLRDAGIPNYQYTYQSPRAGLVSIIETARVDQLRRRSVLRPPVHADPRVERFLRVHHRAKLIGIRAACREAGMASSNYYGLLKRLLPNAA